MLKAVPSLDTSLTAPLSSGAVLAQIQQEGADTLREKLGEGDWVYAIVEDGIDVEIVRITGVAGTLVAIDRAIDQGVPAAFSIGARLTYYIPKQATYDILMDVLTAGVELTGTGAVKVTQTGPYAWNLHVDKITLVSNDPEIEVVDMYPNFFVFKQ